MIKRVAAAIVARGQAMEAQGCHVDDKPRPGGRYLFDGYFDVQELAKAAIEAMYKPTQEMLDNGAREISVMLGDRYIPGPYGCVAERAFQAMLHVVLAKPSDPS